MIYVVVVCQHISLVLMYFKKQNIQLENIEKNISPNHLNDEIKLRWHTIAKNQKKINLEESVTASNTEQIKRCSQLFQVALGHCGKDNKYQELQEILLKFDFKQVQQSIPKPTAKRRKIQTQNLSPNK